MDGRISDNPSQLESFSDEEEYDISNSFKDAAFIVGSIIYLADLALTPSSLIRRAYDSESPKGPLLKGLAWTGEIARTAVYGYLLSRTIHS